MARWPKPPEGSWTEHHPELGTAPVSYEDSISPEFYDQEREAVFKRAWLNVGRVERVPKHGNYFTKEIHIAKTSIVVVRDMNGQVRAFHNICRHRGNKRVWNDFPGAETSGSCRSIKAGVDCIEHGFLATDDILQMMVDHKSFLVSTTSLCDGMAVDRVAPELRKKAAWVFPQARAMLPKAIAAGVKIACGSDAPAIPHGKNADEVVALVTRGMTPMQALRAATVTSAELIEMDHELGHIEAGYLADIIAVPGDPSVDITTTKDVRFEMKDGRIYKHV